MKLDKATLEFKWSTSRGRDTYGYNICSLWVDGRRVTACNGGGYDMKGTSFGNWVAAQFREELLQLTAEDMPAQSHWEPEHARVCAGECAETYRKALMDAIVEGKGKSFERSVSMDKLPEDCWECPTCKGPTHASRDGQRIDDGRYFYGLTFHDPNYDPSKAIVGVDCNDRTLSNESSEGKTVEQVEQEGVSFGLERYQAFYSASSKQPSERHTVPMIDGGCGFEQVTKILQAIGYELEYVQVRSSKRDVYILRRVEAAASAA